MIWGSSSGRVKRECCTSYTLLPLPSNSSRRYFIRVAFIYPRPLPLLLIHLYPFFLYFSLLFIKCVPVVTKSPYYIHHVHLSVRLSTYISVAPKEQICDNLYWMCLFKSVDKIQICSELGKNIGHFTRRILLVKVKAVLI